MNNSGRNDIPPIQDSIALSTSANANIVFNAVHNANNIGITFSTISVILYNLLFTEFATYFISG